MHAYLQLITQICTGGTNEPLIYSLLCTQVHTWCLREAYTQSFSSFLWCAPVQWDRDGRKHIQFVFFEHNDLLILWEYTIKSRPFIVSNDVLLQSECAKLAAFNFNFFIVSIVISASDCTNSFDNLHKHLDMNLISCYSVNGVKVWISCPIYCNYHNDQPLAICPLQKLTGVFFCDYPTNTNLVSFGPFSSTNV